MENMSASGAAEEPSPYIVRYIDETRGNGIFATRALEAGTRLFEEYPLLAMQHGANWRAGVSVCERCFRFLGPLESQVSGLLKGCGAVPYALPERLPPVEGGPELPTAVGCPGGCELRFCSDACAAANFADHHRLLCPSAASSGCGDCGGVGGGGGAGPKRARPEAEAERASMARTAPPLEAALSGMSLDAPPTAVDVTDGGGGGGGGSKGSGRGGSSGAGEPTGLESLLAGLPEDAPLLRFAKHARSTNEIFGLAAKAVAHVLCRLEKEGATTEAYERAMEPFCGPPWWEAVATPDDVTDEAAFRRTLRALIAESWSLLVPALGRYAPPNCPLFTSDSAYARIVGSFEHRNCTVAVASPVEEYFLAVDATPPGPAREALTAITSPVLDALDEAYATPFDGTGLFPLQATLNHSCEPNVTLMKQTVEEESDGRVVARLSRDVAAGEELCNTYVDVSLPVRRRRRELREYGFECDCQRCVRELAAAEAKKGEKKSGKKRLK